MEIAREAKNKQEKSGLSSFIPPPFTFAQTLNEKNLNEAGLYAGMSINNCVTIFLSSSITRMTQIDINPKTHFTSQ